MSTATVKRRLRTAERSGDRGVTIVELMISMAIFSVVLVVFLAALGSMARNTVKSEVRSDTSDQLRNTFQRLDKEVRYASDINTPGTSGDAIYLEYWVPASAGTGASMCVQWRYVEATAELQRRTWAQGDPGSVSDWITLVTDLRNDLSDPSQKPFAVHRAGTSGGKTYLHQRLDIYLDSGKGEPGGSAGGQLQTSFVAQNSSTASVTNNGTTKVCLTGAVQRP